MEISTQSNNVAIIIPARYGSTRLEGKPLLKANNKPIIQWVYEKCKQVKSASKVIVATDDERIFDAVKAFDGDVCMTRKDHKCGSDRIVEVLSKYPDIDIAVNVQGDEPMIQPESIEKSICALQESENCGISTLIRKITDEEEIQNPNVVKVVTDNQGFALYFSRSPVPYERNKNQANVYGHIGLYAYKRDYLIKMSQMPQTSLEKAESLEQLRALQNGWKIKTVEVNYKPLGIDTIEDFNEFLKLVEKNDKKHGNF